LFRPEEEQEKVPNEALENFIPRIFLLLFSVSGITQRKKGHISPNRRQSADIRTGSCDQN